LCHFGWHNTSKRAIRAKEFGTFKLKLRFPILIQPATTYRSNSIKRILPDLQTKEKNF